MSNIRNLENNISRMEEEISNMKSNLEYLKKKEEQGSLYTPKAGSEKAYYIISCGLFGIFKAIRFYANNKDQSVYSGLLFETTEEAEDYAKALNIITGLKRCKGARKFVVGKNNYFPSANLGNDDVGVGCGVDHTLSIFGAYFEAKSHVEEATKKVGKENILFAAKVLS